MRILGVGSWTRNASRGRNPRWAETDAAYPERRKARRERWVKRMIAELEKKKAPGQNPGAQI